MRRGWIFPIVYIVFAVVPSFAEDPDLVFVHRLRRRGMADLAVEYLERLQANPPANIKDVLPLEIAKAKLDLAVGEGNEKKRNRRCDEARATFQAFLSSHPNHPLAPDAALDIARLVAYQGKHLLNQARRADDIGSRLDLTVRARTLFADAAMKLADAARQIDARLETLSASKNPEEQSHRAALIAAKRQAELESGINLFHSALTMPANSAAEIKARANEIMKAKTALEALAKIDSDNPVCWTAQVWIGRCYDELDNKSEARRVYEALAAERRPAAESAARTAEFFMLRLAAEDKQAPNRAEQLRSVSAGLDDWLKRNAGSAESADVQAGRYLLAVLLEEQAQAGIVRDKNGAIVRLSAGARQDLARIERLLKQVADSDGDYADRARQRRAGVLVLLLGDRATGDIRGLMNFEECYLTAQVAAYELTQPGRSPAARARRYERVIAALRRGLSLAASNDSPRDVAEARAMLAYTYLAAGDPYAAAVYGEYLGRGQLAGSRSPEATAYALQGYAGILARDRERSASEDEIRADQERLRTLAQYMEKTWPDEPATDIARHQLGDFLLDEHHYADACSMLSRIAPSYPAIAQARYQEGAAAQRAQAKDVQLTSEQKQQLLRQAVADLERLPEPAPGGSEETTLAACMAKCQLGNLYLLGESESGANLVRAAELGRRLSDLTPKLTLHAEFRPQVQVEADKLFLAGTEGRAYLLLKAGNLAGAQALLNPIYDRVRTELKGKPPAFAAEPWYENYREVQRQVIALRLRIAIQLNQADAGHQALGLLRQISGGLANGNDRLLRIVYDLKKDADEFKKRGEIDKRDQMERGLVTFLDELAKPRDLTNDVRLFLAQAYAGLDRHDRAAELLAACTPPQKDDNDAQTRYQQSQLMLAREHRLAHQTEAAKNVLQQILGSWGKTDLTVRREKVFLLEDAGNYAAAVQECREIKRALLQARIDFDRAVHDEHAADTAERAAKTEADRQKAAQDRATAQLKKNAVQSLRDRYWEFDFYDTRIVLRSCQRVKDPAVREQKIAAVAAAIRRLEGAYSEIVGKDLRDQYLELFEIEPLLKQKYLDADGKALVTR